MTFLRTPSRFVTPKVAVSSNPSERLCAFAPNELFISLILFLEGKVANVNLELIGQQEVGRRDVESQVRAHPTPTLPQPIILPSGRGGERKNSAVIGRLYISL